MKREDIKNTLWAVAFVGSASLVGKTMLNEKGGWYYNSNNKIEDEFYMEYPNQSKNIAMFDDFENKLMELNPKNAELKGWIYVPDHDKNGTFAGHKIYSKPDPAYKK